MEAPWMIAAAVELEIRGLRKHLQHVQEEKIRKGRAWTGRMNGNPFWIVRTGVGPENVRKTLEPLLASRRFSGILSLGYAGGLKDGYRVGDIVIPEEIRSLSPLPEGPFHPPSSLFQRTCKIARQGRWTLHNGRMITSSRVISSSREKQQLGEKHRAGAVEMESSVLAELAEKAGIDFLVVRVILDEVSFSLPDNPQLFQFLKKRQFLKIGRSFVSQPLLVLRLIRLLRNTLRASKRLESLMVGGLLDAVAEEASGTG